ncbi:MAG: Crp/Fnr family transcriptional regulator [Deltaproteobacteria bacterium]|nr:Crp/Fnr family transcriptional regulator [Deltaproteobacteria bacterium]
MQQRGIYPGGAILFTEDEQPRGVYCICSGRVKLSIISSNGRAVIVKITTAGDIIGSKALLSGKPHSLIAETLEPSQISLINKDDFLSFLSKNGDVSLRLAQKLSNELYEAYQGVGNVALKQSYERLIELLLRLCQSHGEPTPDGIILRINLTQQELAETAGMSRRTLTRLLTKLKELQIIECRGRLIIIRDKVALEKILPSENLF